MGGGLCHKLSGVSGWPLDVEGWGKIPNGSSCAWIAGKRVGIISVVLLKSTGFIRLVWRSRWSEEKSLRKSISVSSKQKVEKDLV